MHFDAAKLLRAFLAKHPVFILQPQDCGTGNYDPGLRFGRAECGRGKHAGAQRTIAIRQNNAHLGRACSRIENAGNICHFAAISFVRIGIQPDAGGVTHMNIVQVVLINVTDHPHLGKIGDGEEIRSIVEALIPSNPEMFCSTIVPETGA